MELREVHSIRIWTKDTGSKKRLMSSYVFDTKEQAKAFRKQWLIDNKVAIEATPLTKWSAVYKELT